MVDIGLGRDGLEQAFGFTTQEKWLVIELGCCIPCFENGDKFKAGHEVSWACRAVVEAYTGFGHCLRRVRLDARLLLSPDVTDWR